jgi:hypothetical protein
MTVYQSFRQYLLLRVKPLSFGDDSMIIREHYMTQIRPFYESDLIKIITGIRRCGKSVILRQIMSEIEKTGKHCLFLDFDLRPVSAGIPDADALIAYVNEYLGNDKLYVFLDEIQNVEGWNEAVRTLRLYNTSVFITGSNSQLLSREYTKELSGRYVSFRIRPFVYREAKEYANQMGRAFEISDYLIWGGFSAALEQPDYEARKRYLNDLNDTGAAENESLYGRKRDNENEYQRYEGTEHQRTGTG